MPCVTNSLLAVNAMVNSKYNRQCLKCDHLKNSVFVWSLKFKCWITGIQQSGSDTQLEHLHAEYLQQFFFLPEHFLLLTRHSLISEISGQGLPKGDGYWRTCRVRVSWPRLNPQVLPDREQGLHSLHSPTSQCTDRVKIEVFSYFKLG